jgi:phage shock protein A
MGDVGMAIERAEDKTAQMQARASAVDELIASGALEDQVSGGKDDITRELESLSAGADVDAQLAQMKSQIGGTTAPAQIDAASAEEEKA